MADNGRAVVEQQRGAGRVHIAVAIRQGHGLAVVVQTGDGRNSGAQIDADQLACPAAMPYPFATGEVERGEGVTSRHGAADPEQL
jgi:hypothetical protein